MSSIYEKHKPSTSTLHQPVSYKNERNKDFVKLGMGEYYVIGEEPGYIDLYLDNRGDAEDEPVEFGFKSLDDAAKYVNVVLGRSLNNRYKNLFFLSNKNIHLVQLNTSALENLKNLIEDPAVKVIPYSTDDFIIEADRSTFLKIQKKYKLLETPEHVLHAPDRYGLMQYGDNPHELKGKILPKSPQSGNKTVGYSYKDLMKLGHAARRDNYQYKYNNQDYWENDMNIYEKLNKINDKESLSEKYNVKNLKELKKLQESQTRRSKKRSLKEELTDTQEEAMDIAVDYIHENYSWSDWTSDVVGSTLTVTIWFEDDWGGEDSSETIFTLDINKLVEYMNDEEALGSYIESCENYTNYEARGQEFYRRAEEELEKHFGCTNAYLEPSTQMGRGGTFLFADDMSFEGNFDYQTGEEYIQEDNFDGFLQLCLDSFRPRTDESLKKSSNVKTNEALSDLEGTIKCGNKADKILSELDAENFTKDQVVKVCQMIEDRIAKRNHTDNRTPKQKLKDAFADIDWNF